MLLQETGNGRCPLLNGLEQAPSFENLYHEVTLLLQDVQGEKVTLIFIVLIAEEMLM